METTSQITIRQDKHTTVGGPMQQFTTGYSQEPKHIVLTHS